MRYLRLHHPAFAASVFVLVFIAVLALGGLTPVHAVDCEGVQTAVVDCSGANDTTQSPVVATLVLVIQILTGAVGVVAVGALVYAGIMYASAGGDSSQINKAKEIILNTVIGLIIFAIMGLILNYLIPGGLFTGSGTFGAGGNGQSNVTAKQLLIKTPDISDTDDTGTASGLCYWNHTAAYPKGAQFHIDNKKNATKTNSYAFENSPEGIRYAAAHGYKRIDIDIQTTKDGIIVATHSTNPFMTKGKGTWGGFYDPAGKIKHGLIQDLTWSQVSQLRHKVGGYKIYRLEDIIAALKEADITAMFEFKTPKTLIKHASSLTAMINSGHIRAAFKGITSKPGQIAALTEIRKYGFWSSYIWSGSTHPPIKTSSCG